MKYASIILATVFVALALPACSVFKSSFTPLSATSSMKGDDGGALPSSFAQFPDVPFPEKTKMDLDKTVLLGSGEDWTGKLYLKAPFSSNEMFDFYVSQMPNFGWEQIAVIRSKTSTLNFMRENRVSTIQIENDGSSSYVSIVVMPKSGSRSGGIGTLNSSSKSSFGSESDAFKSTSGAGSIKSSDF